MDGTAQRLAKVLLSPASLQIRQRVVSRVEAMERELKFLLTRDSVDLQFLMANGWSVEKFDVLFILNSVYQLILGPQDAATHRIPQALGSDVRIAHGSTIVDGSYRLQVRNAVDAFFALSFEAGFSQDLLTQATTRDIVYWQARRLRELRGSQ